MSENSEKRINLNTILMFITLGVISWMGVETVQNGKQMATIVATNSERADSVKRLEKKVDDLSYEVSRQRDSIFDLRLRLGKASVDTK